MCITAHFIDADWNLTKRILNFVPISSHKGRDIGIEIEKCLLEWGIDRVFTITVDNAASNDVALLYMKEKISNWGFSIMKCQFLHMRCVSYIVNLIVVDGLRLIRSYVKRVREAIQFVRQSALRMKKFKESCEDEKIQSKSLLTLDVSTRWNSTYLMLESAQKFEVAFKRFEDKDPYFRIDLEQGEGVPDAADWRNVRRMVMFLSHFYEMTLRVSGAFYVTSNSLFYEIYMIYRLLDDFELSSMAFKMKEKYDKYWGDPLKMNQLIYIAAILDPQYKLEWVQFALCKMFNDEGENLAKQVKDVFIALYHEYKEHVSPSKQSEKEQLVDEIQANFCDKDDLAMKEIEIDRPNFDILGWWKLNGPRFPILSRLASDVLTIPISIVASESTFSTGGHVLDAFRSSLTPKVVQALICAEDWLRHSILMVVEEKLDDIQRIERMPGGLLVLVAVFF
ncbi:zinc finger BED domain-containing protein RICESLEEPER 2-like [Prosopis cineraria]|uniref:zinc finger BED domain-containing protein RICESLEEPER 2-like n=1 Tax=Prosopis cineraria TaxID=364024 RepID=UPI00241078A0|nr:zinc finger BED domain-containing protein RICESLEEPER 2-like [Prosopis cineraria]